MPKGWESVKDAGRPLNLKGDLSCNVTSVE